jgi:hypothetical protein
MEKFQRLAPSSKEVEITNTNQVIHFKRAERKLTASTLGLEAESWLEIWGEMVVAEAVRLVESSSPPLCCRNE